jgi:hypothetical protein
MGWVVKLGGAIAGATSIWALAAAGQPSALAQTRGGLWEVYGAPGAAKPILQCIPDTRVLAQFEHRGQACPRTVIANAGTNATIEYNCGSSGFGSSRITVLTPRSLRIETQGISKGLPFNYVIQARRVGDCRFH